MHRLAALIALVVLGIAACEDGPYGAPPPGEFACGVNNFCDVSTQVCLSEPGTSGAQGFSCENLPAACDGTPSCSCVSTCTGASCSTGSDGSVTVTCP